jgi:DNA-binding transcriptional LysR family regulator
MNIDDLRLFVDVARLGSFAAAARARNADPSAISRAIAALETELRLRLFQRTTRKVVLTDEGALVLEKVSSLVDDLDAVCEDARALVNAPTGRLRMTASNAFAATCITPLLPQFRKQYPGLKLELVLSDDNLDLVKERIDLAVRLGATTDQTLSGYKLFETRYRVCVSPTYAKQSQVLRHPADLSNHRCLLFPFGDFRSRWTFKSLDKGVTEVVSVDGDLITSSALTLKSCAIDGMGPTLLPSWLVDQDIAAGRLLSVFDRYRVTATSYDTAAWILYPSRSFIPAKVKAVTAFMRANLKNRTPR